MTYARFEEEFLRDVDEDRVRPVEEYQQRWPALAQEIAQDHAAYLRIRGDHASRQAGVATTANASPPPATIGRYRVLGLLDRGGMGELHRAYDPDLDREVVLKTLRPYLSDDPRAMLRLQREARLAGKLKHPGLCPILDVQRDGDRTYVVLPLLEGETLEEQLTRARHAHQQPDALWAVLSDGGDLPALLLLLERIARAVHAAHEAGVLHRDLKPANVMLQPDGMPVVLDFGLAKDMADGSALTVTGEIMGSPPYMAPEQVSGRADAIDRQTDVYALGVMMYELLTLTPPYSGQSTVVLFAAIVRGEPTRPCKRNRAVPRDVEAVCLQAMAQERHRRYATAGAFADDLANLRLLRPTRAKPLAPATRWLRRARRNPLLSGLTAAASILLVVAISLWSYVVVKRTARSDLALAVQSVADAQMRGDAPPPAAISIIEAAVPEANVREPFLRDPLDLRTKDALLRWALENLRGDGAEGIVLLAPRGAIAEARPSLRFRSGLPTHRGWRFVARCEQVASGRSHEAHVEQPAHTLDQDTVFRFEQALEPGAWRWSVELDQAAQEGLAWPTGHGEFTVVSETVIAAISNSRPTTGDDLLDRQLEAAALLAHDLAILALSRLDVELAAQVRPTDRARHLLLRMRAFAILGEQERVEETQRAWQLVKAAQGTRDTNEEKVK